MISTGPRWLRCCTWYSKEEARSRGLEWHNLPDFTKSNNSSVKDQCILYHLYCVCASSGESINFGAPERLKWRRPFVLAWGPPLIVVVQTVLITREKMLQSDYIQIPVFERNMQGHKALLPLCRNCFSSFFSFAFNSSCIICHCAVSFFKFYSVVMCDCHV